MLVSSGSPLVDSLLPLNVVLDVFLDHVLKPPVGSLEFVYSIADLLLIFKISPLSVASNVCNLEILLKFISKLLKLLINLLPLLSPVPHSHLQML